MVTTAILGIVLYGGFILFFLRFVKVMHEQEEKLVGNLKGFRK